MEMKLAIVGLVVGFLIGLTGVGSGSLLAPLLLILGIQPATVVGSDLGYSVITKLTGIGVHFAKGAVKWRYVGLMALGSIPGAVLGTKLISHLLKSQGAVKHGMGWVLIVTAVIALSAEFARRRGSNWAGRLQHPRPWVIPFFGLVIGLIVGATSVGSGSLIDLTLMLFSPLTAAEVVGTGIAHGVLLTGVATALHWNLGTVDTALVFNLLLGSLPGVLLGSFTAHRAPTRNLKLVVASLILVSGFSMIGR